MPWLHYKLRDIGMGNVWLTFNSPDRDRLVSPPWLAALTIFSVALIWLAAATGALRLVPSHWHLRKSPICDRTWPAFLVSFVLVAIWFCQSVMPYRIPGAVDVDSSSWPVLQILHVEKRGLQFHENCARVHGGYKGYPLAVSFTSNDRRLFQYSFQKGYGSGGELREPVREHIRAIIQRSESPKPSSDKVKPLRAWNADGWYITGKGIGLGAYTTENGQAPSKEVVELFRELQSIPHTREGQSLQRDVCLGFCYDPLSGFGYLYANQRCFNDGNRVVCQ